MCEGNGHVYVKAAPDKGFKDNLGLFPWVAPVLR